MVLVPTISPRVSRICWKPAAAVLVLMAAGSACSPPPAAETSAQPAPARAAQAPPSAQPESSHRAHVATPADMTTPPPPGQRWATDAPLRDGMARIRQAVGALEQGVHGPPDATQQQAAAAQVDAAVADMIASCKLVPEADAALHGLLASFVSGAAAARAGRLGQPEVAAMQDALAQYPQRFDDPAWDQPAQD